jgi:hypothetical protein
LRSPLVLHCVRDYLAGRRQSLQTVAELDLQSAPEFVRGALPPPNSAVTAVAS